MMRNQTDKFSLQRFIDAQDKNNMFSNAMTELRNGRKRTHWIWYIYPQLKGLGYSYNAQYYGISGIEEAKAYLTNETLNSRIRRACEELIHTKHNDLKQVLGHIDYLKAFSCLTLFDAASPNDVFSLALKECYDERRDENTLKLLGINSINRI